MVQRKTYDGFQRKLVLAFDVGTTFSGISYSILDPGEVPKIQGVTRFPAQEQVSGSSKIPTVLYYDNIGNARAVGAEAMCEGLYEQAEDEGWFKVEWFKLHLRPLNDRASSITAQLPPLPPNKTIVQVYSDFLRYLLDCASKYIQETHPNGSDLWRTLAPQAEFVLSHPNGWEGSQQSQMRRAAVGASLIPDSTAGHDRLHFVTEGEASLHYSIENGLPPNSLKNGDGVVIVDAGGGTVDISAYAQSTDSPDSRKTKSVKFFEEIAPPQCHFHGSVFVSLHARVFLADQLAESTFVDDLDSIVRCFDKTTKLRFRNANDPQFIKFGSTRDNEPEFNIRYGQLKLAGSDVAQFFEPSITCVVDAVMEQRRLAHKPFTHVVLVGGFATSDWLYSKVQERLEPEGFNVLRPDNHLNKAVADGAMSFYIDHCVRTRVSRFTYGQFSNTRFNVLDPEHQKRIKDTYQSLSGHTNIKNNFSIILPKNTQVSEEKEFAKEFHISRKSIDKLAHATVHVWCYRGQIATPQWKDVDKDNYTKLCTIEVDLGHLRSAADQFKKEGPDGPFYRLHYKLILLFGLSELKAVFSWKENGVEKRSPANIVYDPEDAN